MSDVSITRVIMIRWRQAARQKKPKPHATLKKIHVIP
jgi:hypothetical protein